MIAFNRYFSPVACILLLSLFLALSCGKRESSQLEQGLSFYRQNKLKEALPLLKGAVESDPQNADAHAWLGETYRRLGQTEDAIKAARKAMELDPCHSFGHTVLASAYTPKSIGSWEGANADTSWYHLGKAAACDSSDGNIWMGGWVEAIRRGDQALEKRALRLLIQTDFLTPALLAYNRWMLRHLPKNALLLTNGDMDTYPAVALQEVEEFRTDVVIANRSLLNTSWYARHLRDRYGVPLTFEDDQLDSLKTHRDDDGNLILMADQIIEGWLELRQRNAFPRPIAIAVTVGDMSFAEDTKDHLTLAGPFHSWLPFPAENPEDTTMMRMSLADIDPEDFRGPLVSPQDRSPVRLVGTNRLVTNITAAALRYSQALIESGRAAEVFPMLKWAQGFEEKTALGPVFAEQIEELKEKAIDEVANKLDIMTIKRPLTD